MKRSEIVIDGDYAELRKGAASARRVRPVAVGVERRTDSFTRRNDGVRVVRLSRETGEPVDPPATGETVIPAADLWGPWSDWLLEEKRREEDRSTRRAAYERDTAERTRRARTVCAFLGVDPVEVHWTMGSGLSLSYKATLRLVEIAEPSPRERPLSRRPGSLDDALYAASCYAAHAEGGSRTATVLVAVDAANREHYRVDDGEVGRMRAEDLDWRPAYVVRSPEVPVEASR